MSQYKKGFLEGQKSEMEVFLDNLHALKDELDSVGYDSKQSYLNVLISDLANELAGE